MYCDFVKVVMQLDSVPLKVLLREFNFLVARFLRKLFVTAHRRIRIGSLYYPWWESHSVLNHGLDCYLSKNNNFTGQESCTASVSKRTVHASFFTIWAISFTEILNFFKSMSIMHYFILDAFLNTIFYGT